MKILQVHNEYQYIGGEEVVIAAEQTMLQNYGHHVFQWILDNSILQNYNFLKKAKYAVQSIWSFDSYLQLKKKLQECRPNIVHVHNTVPLLSPSIYAACHDSYVPVVQTLHNYKFICPGSNLYRNHRICEECVGKKFTYPALVHGCYRKDYVSTWFAVMGLTVNRLRGTYQHEIDTYIALTEFARQKFIEGGLPSEKIAVKPNFITHDIKLGNHKGGYALFVGRLIPQKGVETLLQAWNLLDSCIPLKIVGRGSLETLFKSNLPEGVEYLDALPRDKVLQLMQDASLLVFPTEWYETFGLVIIEAFATGLPVVASRTGGVIEIVKDGLSGWHFRPGDPQDLARVVQSAWSHPGELQRRGILARKEYEDYYSVEKTYQTTINIYKKAIDNFSKSYKT
ncbi:MAG: glycosyltransferase family 4 protein [Scytonema sp. PMC 1069.18]|nr:glycosyltransferase family 4 protein [Scytonema sp. PMC 1069.18]